MHWGQAEEVGKAARVLSSYGIDDGRIVISAIERFSENNALCVGPALCDTANDFKNNVHLGGVDSPALILPFLQMMLDSKDICLKVNWIGFEAAVSESEIFCFCRKGLAEAGPVSIEIKSIETFEFKEAKHFSRIHINEKALEVLNELAQKTYAPATDESRISGAGAGLSDND